MLHDRRNNVDQVPSFCYQCCFRREQCCVSIPSSMSHVAHFDTATAGRNKHIKAERRLTRSDKLPQIATRRFIAMFD